MHTYTNTDTYIIYAYMYYNYLLSSMVMRYGWSVPSVPEGLAFPLPLEAEAPPRERILQPSPPLIRFLRRRTGAGTGLKKIKVYWASKSCTYYTIRMWYTILYAGTGLKKIKVYLASKLCTYYTIRMWYTGRAWFMHIHICNELKLYSLNVLIYVVKRVTLINLHSRIEEF